MQHSIEDYTDNDLVAALLSPYTNDSDKYELEHEMLKRQAEDKMFEHLAGRIEA